MLSKGQKINDRYEIIKTIGEGGMANVYLANDTILDRKVAIKVLRGDLSNDEKFIRRFKREALSVSNLSHPNIVEVYDVGEEDGNYYIVMEYIEGKTLDQQSFSKEQIKDIMHQLCGCLDSLHKLNPPIIHRDIKPENIIYHNNKVTLLDFGIARFLDSKKSKDTLILGSVGYAASEQFGFQQSNPQTDIYALGKLMNYLLNGSLEHQDNISFDLKQIILKATQLDYKNRYNSVKEMDLAIQQKLVVIPPLNNDTFKSKMISLAWIVFTLMIVVDMEPGETINNSFINKLSCFLFIYFLVLT